MYEEFAPVYDVLMHEVNYDQWADYLFRHMLNSKREIKKVLEFGCGTGSITERLAKKGFDMTGVDLSEEMLTVADEKFREEGLNIRLLLGDMANFQTHEKYDCIVSACDSVNYLPDLESERAFIESSFEALEPGGLLLFDMNTVTKYKNVIGDRTFIYDTDEVYCTWESEPDFENDRMNYHLTFFVPDEEGKYSRMDEEQTQYIFYARDILKILRETGFKDIKCYTFGTFLQGGDEADRIQFAAVRPAE